ncbi:polysaccharide ABC transporter ATP-binding protein [Opitutus terrae]|uniref:ABC transporter related n=1 Tax=Opitutus terrae (strain DSM 11246 / JCM 15787 / PB90-1) TaxID=452637 RepID=B1ZT71_OPITP|nr:polysaccharide ABC transporter ATP-binding protein [Opitutus terrae]ACB76525.1 ABC transporter related [Opitutus terrae PB90-1]
MSHPAISIRNISKKYRLGLIGMTTLRDELQRRWARLRRDDLALGVKNNVRNRGAEFWALRDISFDVQPGEVVGLIGRNGAGKSTLLKVLSRITEPTLGEIRLRGRVASLLEVGTGFHPELSGRENIFLNGAVLGMTRAETRRKFDEIVEFSEIGKFLDTPVKRYSSGMYVRLAFAVAAHLDPEILIVDEVLAVGDVAFQRKCLGKVKEISQGQHRTVIFVSHNMNAVENICTHGVMLRNGQLVREGSDVRDIIRQYLADGLNPDQEPVWQNDTHQLKNDYCRIDRFLLADPQGDPLRETVRNDTSVSVIIEGEILKPNPNLQCGYGLFSDEMDLLYISTHLDQPESEWVELPRGSFRLTTKIPRRFLNEGRYHVGLFFALNRREKLCEPGGKGSPMLTFEIRGGLSDSPAFMSRRSGFLSPILEWETRTGVELLA